MCGPHSNQFPDWLAGGQGRRHNVPGPVDPQIAIDQRAALAAQDAAAAWRGRILRSTLNAGSRNVVGAPSVLGASSGGSNAPGGGGGYRLSSPGAAGSIMGAQR